MSTGGVGGGATGGSAGGPQGDPCLSSDNYYYNGDVTCGGDPSYYDGWTCENQQVRFPPPKVGPVTEFPWRMRLPGNPGNSCGCSDVAYAVGVDLDLTVV
jgi:hypothetical protein